jgi:hypothetical protein
VWGGDKLPFDKVWIETGKKSATSGLLIGSREIDSFQFVEFVIIKI